MERGKKFWLRRQFRSPFVISQHLQNGIPYESNEMFNREGQFKVTVKKSIELCSLSHNFQMPSPIEHFVKCKWNSIIKVLKNYKRTSELPSNLIISNKISSKWTILFVAHLRNKISGMTLSNKPTNKLIKYESANVQ